MAKKPTKPFRMAPLQRLKVRPIEDPAEQAALDERIKRSNAEAGVGVPMPDGERPASRGDGPDDAASHP